MQALPSRGLSYGFACVNQGVIREIAFGIRNRDATAGLTALVYQGRIETLLGGSRQLSNDRVSNDRVANIAYINASAPTQRII